MSTNPVSPSSPNPSEFTQAKPPHVNPHAGNIALPNRVYEAWALGELSVVQFFYLTYLYRKAGVGLIARSVSPEDFLYETRGTNVVTGDSPAYRAKVVREAARRLRGGGWYGWDYKHGQIRPYNVFLKSNEDLPSATGAAVETAIPHSYALVDKDAKGPLENPMDINTAK